MTPAAPDAENLFALQELTTGRLLQIKRGNRKSGWCTTQEKYSIKKHDGLFTCGAFLDEASLNNLP